MVDYVYLWADGIHVNVRLDEQKLCLLVMIGVRAAVLAAGDGALGFRGALREVYPETREQRCWFHKIANALAARILDIGAN